MAEQQPTADSPAEFRIFVKTLSGQNLAVQVSLDDTVQDLQVKLSAQDSSLGPETARVIYNQQCMNRDLTLRYYEIKPDCTVFCLRRLRGGGSPAVESQLPGKAMPWYKDHGPIHLQGMDIKPRHFDLRKLVADPHESLPAKGSGSAEASFPSMNLGSSPQGTCRSCTGEVLPEVTPKITRGSGKTMYQAHLPGEGIFRCSITGLSFEVKSAVTVTYRYATWTQHLSRDDQETWVPAGPLFHIVVQPGIVRAVHLPHFICLAEDIDTNLCFIAHFESGKMTLQRPTRLIAFSAVLENPSFSLLGVLWRRLRSTLNSFPMHSLVLIFHQLSAADTTLHLYLIPDDNSVKQAVEKQERNWNSKLIPKPPPFNPLFFGCSYRVTSTRFVEITPDTELPFCYKSPKEQQLFVEIYIRNMVEEMSFLMTDTRSGTEVWRASLRSGDINLLAHASKTISVMKKRSCKDKIQIRGRTEFCWTSLRRKG
ncbi:caspase recruitment domain-containing protein 8, transcript variant X2 [Columba livia]|uniref:Caspase recruitment domain-containing protein 8, transcript variant X2 n=1 Tax=Columba livia TaxID=8932 RepID=A0A2I0LKD0_COLLI|nr:caspase recruitment domain-containing protein 8 isoform X2 [Columba livia]PKK17901.1 caspase recruitment domain-containing protein 8, transcript variant X2 [Columba livia]